MPDLFNDELPSVITLADQINELDRELAMRFRVYPRWVANGKLTERQASAQIRRLEAARNTLVMIHHQTRAALQYVVDHFEPDIGKVKDRGGTRLPEDQLLAKVREALVAMTMG